MTAGRIDHALRSVFWFYIQAGPVSQMDSKDMDIASREPLKPNMI